MAFSKLPCLLVLCQLGAAGAGHSCDLVGGQEEGENLPPPRARHGDIDSGYGRWLWAVRQRGPGAGGNSGS